ncbi:multiubiquitin domain-containing protein [Pseudomonas sp. PI1]|uniref:multiubiquitin domain-containing protein n=1 Tax=Pseudomonas sp. PI1 TaxID=1582493 RepID=UPI0009E2B153|nr:multiubiquitin domain-containing protein [Pseudomonas sp. PI1]
MSSIQDDIDDVGEALREGRPLKAARGYLIRFALDSVDFRSIEVSDPLPTGRQIFSAAGLDYRADLSLYAILASGDFEDVSLDETFDLRGKGAERFIAFRTDRDYKLTLDGRQLLWGMPVITGEALYTLSGIDSHHAVFLEVRGGTDQVIEPGDSVDLTQSGVEHFITAVRPVKGYVIVVNSRDEPVPGKQVTFEQVVQLAFPGAPVEPNVRYSMTYRNAASKPHAGELAEGGFVEVKHEGTIFNVTKTVQS